MQVLTDNAVPGLLMLFLRWASISSRKSLAAAYEPCDELFTQLLDQKSWKSVQASVLSEALMPVLNLHGVLVFVAANDVPRLPPAFTENLPVEFLHLR